MKKAIALAIVATLFLSKWAAGQTVKLECKFCSFESTGCPSCSSPTSTWVFTGIKVTSGAQVEWVSVPYDIEMKSDGVTLRWTQNGLRKAFVVATARTQYANTAALMDAVKNCGCGNTPGTGVGGGVGGNAGGDLSGPFSNLQIIPNAVTNVELADMPARTIKGANVAGDPVNLTPLQVANIISFGTFNSHALAGAGGTPLGGWYIAGMGHMTHAPGTLVSRL